MLLVHWVLFTELTFLHGLTASLDRIIGGAKVTIEKFPYQLSLRFNGRHICGAVIISKDTGLTAAHCIPFQGSYSVRAGSTYYYKDGVITYVKQAILHPNHTKDNEDFDIAILKFSEPLRYSDKIKPIKLPNQDEELPPDAKCYVSGWGSFLMNFGDNSDELRAVEVPVVDNNLCVNIYRSTIPITPRMLCAGYREGGKDACQGDSGGPLVVDGTLRGLVSWGVKCAEPGYPGVYTKISALRNYIRANSGV